MDALVLHVQDELLEALSGSEREVLVALLQRILEAAPEETEP